MNKQGTTAARVAALLREEILAAGPDAFIGVEDTLMSRLGVSRQTLRMAVTMLTQEGLLTVRRGNRGGFYARVPTSESVAHVASVFLRSQGAGIEDLTRVNGLVAAEAARLAAANSSVEARRILSDLVEQSDRAHDGSVAEAALAFNRYIGVLSGSPTLTLFTMVLSDLASGEYADRIFSSPAKVAACQRTNRAVARAIAAGNQDEAADVVRRHHEQLLVWLRQPSRGRRESEPELVSKQ